MTMTAKNTVPSMVTLTNAGNIMNVTLATCPHCGKEFFKTHHKQKYCTMECAKAAIVKGKAVPKNQIEQVGQSIPTHLYHGNFKNKTEEHQRMLILRSQGFTNAQIAKKTGTYYGKVLYTIGTQPKFMTANSMKAGGAKNHARCLALKANKIIFGKAQKYEKACNHAADLQHQIDLLQARLIRAKANVTTLEADYVSSAGVETSGMIHCACCGKLISAAKKGRRVYCDSCAPIRATALSYKAKVQKRMTEKIAACNAAV